MDLFIFALYALKYITHPSFVILSFKGWVVCLSLPDPPAHIVTGWIWTTGDTGIELDGKTRREKPRYISLAFGLEHYLPTAMNISLSLFQIHHVLASSFSFPLLLSALCFTHDSIMKYHQLIWLFIILNLSAPVRPPGLGYCLFLVLFFFGGGGAHLQHVEDPSSGLNWHHSSNPSCCSNNVGSLTSWATRELL